MIDKKIGPPFLSLGEEDTFEPRKKCRKFCYVILPLATFSEALSIVFVVENGSQSIERRVALDKVLQPDSGFFLWRRTFEFQTLFSNFTSVPE